MKNIPDTPFFHRLFNDMPQREQRQRLFPLYCVCPGNGIYFNQPK